MTPEENFQFVNDYLKVMSPIVSQHHGFIDKYIGDAIMALFNNADDAMNAAIHMQKTLTTYNMERLRSQKKPISIGIGLHKGIVRLGTIGEQDRMDGTVISDAVNLASRIEGLTRFYGVQCLISEATYLSLKDPSQFLIRFIDKVKVKGKHVPIAIYEVFNGYSVEIQNQKLGIQGVFEEATKLYTVKEFAKALVLFEQILAKFPDDLVSQSYLSRCNQYISEGADDSWEAVLQLETK
jgi:two-component system sensor histidine kinase ChiS